MNIPNSVLQIRSSRIMAVMIVMVVFFLVSIFLAPVGLSGRSSAALAPLAIAMLATEGLYIGWLLCIGIVSNAISPSRLKKSPRFAALVFPIAVGYSVSSPFLLFTAERPAPLVPVLHLLSMFVNFYILWFASRSIHASELQRPPTLRDYLPTFLLLWFAMIFPPAVKWTHERVQRNAGVAAQVQP